MQSRGLTPSAAAEVLKRNGPNLMTPPAQTAAWKKYLICLGNLFNLLLIVSGIMCYIVLAVDFKENFQNVHPFDYLVLIMSRRRTLAPC